MYTLKCVFYWVWCKLSGHRPVEVRVLVGNGKWDVWEVACARCGVELEDRSVLPAR